MRPRRLCRRFLPAACVFWLCALPALEAAGQATDPPAGTAPQGTGARPEGRVFQPPPVPEFMLRRPERPLTREEMQRQADEAAARARPPAPPAADSGDDQPAKKPDELLKNEKRQ